MHNPYQLPSIEMPESLHVQPHQQNSRRHISHTMAVMQEIQVFGDGWASSSHFGWDVLHKLWDIQPDSFDHAALTKLATQPIHAQQHVLLTVATMDVRKVKNLSALMNTLISEFYITKPVCFAFLAGHCREAGCVFFHPVKAPGWMTVEHKWQLSWLDFDYSVMNVLLQKPLAMQDKILWRFSLMRLRSIHNLSALLYSVISQCESLEKPQPCKHRQSHAASKPAMVLHGATRPAVESCEVTTAELANLPINPSDPPSQHLPECTSESECSASSNPETSAQAALLSPLPHTPNAFTAMPPATKVPMLVQQKYPDPSARTLPQPSGQAQSSNEQEQTNTSGRCRSEWIIQALHTSSAPAPRVGWEVLRNLWGIGPFNFAPHALEALRKQSSTVQEHILLSIAAMDLDQPHDLTGLLQAALTHSQRPVCWRYLAALCPEAPCRFHHPPFVPGWNHLRSQGISHVHIEFAVLNVFFMLPVAKQEQILTQLADCHTLAAHTISGMMLHMVERSLNC
eukprot:GGOE01011284.1.p1 GENE.GGOE01011284.1~~GGOE01011284.1.p1  ORF type:complete len:522 (-),score=70.57 GGOE01011284.1:1534-3069(-)